MGEEAMVDGWVTAKLIEVTPLTAQPGDELYIRALFENSMWLPSSSTLLMFFDGTKIYEWDATFAPWEGGWVETKYNIPNTVSEGVHRVLAREYTQSTKIPFVDISVVVAPPPGKGKISFVSTPAGASVFVNEQYKGKTPLVVTLDPGTYDIKGEYLGQTKTDRITLSSGQVLEYSFEFEFEEKKPTDWGKIALYVGAGIAVLGALYVVTRKPEAVKSAAERAAEISRREYERAKEAYRKLRA